MDHNKKENISGIILAGGKSSRFGQDKGLYLYNNKPLVMYAIELLKPVCGEVLISTNKPEDYSFTGLKIIEDIYKDCGPIGGIHSGLLNTSGQIVVFLACDMPFVPSRLIEFLASALDNNYQAVVPRYGEFYETMCIAMKRNTLNNVEKAIYDSRFRLFDMLQDLHTLFINADTLPFISAKSFLNLNSKKDLESLP